MPALHTFGRVTLGATALLAFGMIGTAQAAAPQPFTITEQVNFNTGFNTFTTTGPLCASGTFVDEVTAVGGSPDHTSKINLLIKTVYTCADGSGTFNAKKHVFLTLNGDDTTTNTGPISFHRGTGQFNSLAGHGVDNGRSTADGFGVGQISGVIV